MLKELITYVAGRRFIHHLWKVIFPVLLCDWCIHLLKLWSLTLSHLGLSGLICEWRRRPTDWISFKFGFIDGFFRWFLKCTDTFYHFVQEVWLVFFPLSLDELLRVCLFFFECVIFNFNVFFLIEFLLFKWFFYFLQ